MTNLKVGKDSTDTQSNKHTVLNRQENLEWNLTPKIQKKIYSWNKIRQDCRWKDHIVSLGDDSRWWHRLILDTAGDCEKNIKSTVRVKTLSGDKALQWPCSVLMSRLSHKVLRERELATITIFPVKVSHNWKKRKICIDTCSQIQLCGKDKTPGKENVTTDKSQLIKTEMGNL